MGAPGPGMANLDRQVCGMTDPERNAEPDGASGRPFIAISDPSSVGLMLGVALSKITVSVGVGEACDPLPL